MAALLLAELTASGRKQQMLPAVTDDLARLGSEARAALPNSFTELVARVEVIDGVALRHLAEKLNADRYDLDQKLSEPIEAADMGSGRDRGNHV